MFSRARSDCVVDVAWLAEDACTLAVVEPLPVRSEPPENRMSLPTRMVPAALREPALLPLEVAEMVLLDCSRAPVRLV